MIFSDVVQSDVGAYFKGKLYVFLPNLCNAKCSFCHVQPTFAPSANLSDSALSGFERVLENASAAGFNEVKITGGEPLMFSNVRSLFDMVRDSDLDYSVLTNGLELPAFREYFEAHPPLQLMVSIHSARNNSEVFGVDRSDTTSLVRTVGELTKGGLRTTVTSVVTRDSADEIVELYSQLDSGIDCKIVRGTDVPAGTQVSSAEFEEISGRILAAAGPHRSIRLSDTSARTCELSTRGFFSIAMPSFGHSSCCAAITNLSRDLDARDPADFHEMVQRCLRERSWTLRSAPCKTGSDHCPLTLRAAR